MPEIQEMTADELEVAAHDLEERRLAAHVAHQAEGLAIAARRNELALPIQLRSLNPDERTALRQALDAADAADAPDPEAG